MPFLFLKNFEVCSSFHNRIQTSECDRRPQSVSKLFCFPGLISSDPPILQIPQMIPCTQTVFFTHVLMNLL